MGVKKVSRTSWSRVAVHKKLVVSKVFYEFCSDHLQKCCRRTPNRVVSRVSFLVFANSDKCNHGKLSRFIDVDNDNVHFAIVIKLITALFGI